MGDEAAAGERRLAKLWRMNKQLIDDSAPLYGCVGFDLMSCLVPRPVLGERKQDWEDKVYNFKALMKLNPSAFAADGACPPRRNIGNACTA